MWTSILCQDQVVCEVQKNKQSALVRGSWVHQGESGFTERNKVQRTVFRHGTLNWWWTMSTRESVGRYSSKTILEFLLINYVRLKMYRVLQSDVNYVWLIYYIGIHLGLFVSIYILVNDLPFCPFRFNFAFWILKILNGSPCFHQPHLGDKFLSLWFILSVSLCKNKQIHVYVLISHLMKQVIY